jgi:proline racemase
MSEFSCAPGRVLRRCDGDDVAIVRRGRVVAVLDPPSCRDGSEVEVTVETLDELGPGTFVDVAAGGRRFALVDDGGVVAVLRAPDAALS